MPLPEHQSHRAQIGTNRVQRRLPLLSVKTSSTRFAIHGNMATLEHILPSTYPEYLERGRPGPPSCAPADVGLIQPRAGIDRENRYERER